MRIRIKSIISAQIGTRRLWTIPGAWLSTLVRVLAIPGTMMLAGSSPVKMLPLESHRRRRYETGATVLIGMALACACLLMLASSASAANYTWTGASTTSHNWSDAANWEGTAPSGTVGTLTFPELSSAACTANPATAACYETANDISGLAVEGMSFEGSYDINQPCFACHPAPGEGITLGAGGLKGSGVTANIPITLSAPQTWSASVGLDSVLSGEQALNLPIAHGQGDTFNGGANVGPIKATGSDSADTGESAGDNGTIWVGTPDPAGSGPAVLNGTDKQPVTISDLALGSNFATVGPLTMKGGDIMFGLLGASPTLTVEGGVTFDAASALQMTINTSPGETNASQVDANGTVDLGGAHLSLSTRFGLEECDVPAGQTYTLVSATGSLEGTFGGLPDGSTVPLQRCDGAAQALRINYTAHSVTATVVGPSFTWSGGAAPGTPNWSNATNWAGTAPSGVVGALAFPVLSSGACTTKPATGTCYSSTNDVSGLEVGAMLLDNAAPYMIKGEGITLGAGGLTASTTSSEGSEGGTTLEVPIVLGAPQTWSLDGDDNDANGVFADTVTGAPANTLGIDLTDEAQLDFGGNVGPVTITGENAVNVGSTAGANGAVALSGSSLNGTDGEAVSVTDAGLDANGPGASVGPLRTNGAFVSVGGLVGGGDLTVDGAVTLDSASVLQLSINGPGNAYSQLRASGAINLANAQLVLEGVKPGLVQGECPTLTAGQVDTLITTTGSLLGTFAGVPNGGTVKLSDCTGAVPTVEIHYTAHTVTATTVAPSFTWSGGGGHGADTWSNAANWEGGVAPSDGETIETLTLPRLTGASVSTNDLTGLTINHIQADTSQGDALSGNGLTLGSGGITLTATELPFLALSVSAPLRLSSSQTWNVSGPNPSPPIVSLPEVEVGSLTGENANLTINLNNLDSLFLESFRDQEHFDDELGDVTVNGSVVKNTLAGGGVEEHKSDIELPARFNAGDGHRLTVRDVDAYSAVTGTATGPITAEKSNLGLSGSEIGEVTAIDSAVVINGRATGVALDPQSSLGFLIHTTGTTPGEDYEQLTSTGAINLGGGELVISSYQDPERKCPPPPVGQVYTLVSTTGSLTGVFNNATNGSTLVAECVGTASGPPVVERVYSYRINYNMSGSPKTVTATALPAVPTAYEEPPTVSGTATQEQSLTESHAAWSNSPTSYSYQWERCDSSGNNCQAISGATGRTYVLTLADVGSTVRVQETASNGEGTSTPQVSAPTAVVQASSGGSGGGGTTGTSTGGTSTASTPIARAATTPSEPTPAPIVGQRQTASVISGTVTVRLKGTTKFVPLPGASTIPDGSEVEATNGHVLITVATLTPGKTQTAEVWGGRFLIHQEHTGSGETHFILSPPLTGCPRVTLPRGDAAALAAGAKHSPGPKARHLWVSEHGGSWGTNGRYVSTTVEGTHWLTVDECNQSRVTVVAGKVKVHDLVHNRTKILTAGESYVAGH